MVSFSNSQLQVLVCSPPVYGTIVTVKDVPYPCVYIVEVQLIVASKSLIIRMSFLCFNRLNVSAFVPW